MSGCLSPVCSARQARGRVVVAPNTYWCWVLCQEYAQQSLLRRARLRGGLQANALYVLAVTGPTGTPQISTQPFREQSSSKESSFPPDSAECRMDHQKDAAVPPGRGAMSRLEKTLFLSRAAPYSLPASGTTKARTARRGVTPHPSHRWR